MDIEKIDTVSNESYPYISEEARRGVAKNLLLYAHGMLSQCNKVKHYKELKKISQKVEMNLGKKKPKMNHKLARKWEKLSPVREAVIDDVKIITSFEWIFKAKLLENGFLIHKININKLHKLAKKQFESPISVDEYLGHDSFLVDREKRHKSLPKLRKQTLSFSQMLSKNYTDSFLFKEDQLLDLLEKINKRRNRIHYLNAHIEKISTKEVDIIIEYANRSLVKEIMDRNDDQVIKNFSITYF